MNGVECGKLNGILAKIGQFLIGFCACLLVPVLIVFLSPFCLYWIVVCKILVPIFGKDIVEPAQNDESSLEFLKSKQHIHPRLSLVVALVLEGTIPQKDLLNLLHTKWIEAENEKGELKYPHLRQYIEEWMGFMFWKEEKSFNLGNHFYYAHEIEENANERDSKAFVDGLVESLINKPYRLKQSPWEVHVVYGFKDSVLLRRSKEETLTVLLFRCHHAMASRGQGISKLFEEILMKPEMFQPSIENEEGRMGSKLQFRQILEMFSTILIFPFKLVNEVGSIVFPIFHFWKDPWHIPDRRKDWMQLYSKSPLIPLEKIKLIQNHLQMSMEAVILSSISLAINKVFNGKGYHGSKLQMGLTLPEQRCLEQEESKIFTTIVDLPIDQKLSSIDRLNSTQRNLSKARSSFIPILKNFWGELISFQISLVAHHLFQNRTLSTFYLQMPGPEVESKLCLNSSRLISTYFASGGAMGCSGVSFQVFIYKDHFHISATAESGVIDQMGLEEILKDINSEIDVLHQNVMECRNRIVDKEILSNKDATAIA